ACIERNYLCHVFGHAGGELLAVGLADVGCGITEHDDPGPRSFAARLPAALGAEKGTGNRVKLTGIFPKVPDVAGLHVWANQSNVCSVMTPSSRTMSSTTRVVTPVMTLVSEVTMKSSASTPSLVRDS